MSYNACEFCLGIHESLNSHLIDIQTESEFVAAKIINGKQPIVVASLYRQPNNDESQMQELTNAILTLCESNPGAAIWISGDINLPDIDWQSLSITSHQYKLSINNSFLNLLERSGLEQTIDFPTRGDKTLDVCITNRPSLTNRKYPLPGLSDHHVVFKEVDTQATRKKPVRREILLWKKSDTDAIRERIKKWSDVFVNTYSTTTPVENLASAIQSELENVIKDLIPCKLSSTRQNQPWFNSTTKHITRRKARAFKKACLTNKKKDWSRYKRLKKECLKTCRAAYNNYISMTLSTMRLATRSLVHW